MVDLLDRVRQLANFVDLIESMPMKLGVVAWGALLGSCRIHGHIQIDKQVIKQFLLVMLVMCFLIDAERDTMDKSDGELKRMVCRR
uniref:Uncharacterized protein n=1 Tax=Oryza brachyantha TaxID=4533 RepID=J3LFA9_ORYBR